MISGYDKPLYILPFDHRHSYEEGLFHWHEPLTPEQVAEVAASKQVIYAGFKAAIAAGMDKDRAGILVDENFGADILRDATSNGFITCMSTEKSGQDEFDFEYGKDFERHFEEFNPTFAKVLVRYNPDGDAGMNERQAKRLHKLSEYLSKTNRLFMFELLVPAEKAQLETVGGDKDAYDSTLRPGLMASAIYALQQAGVEPDVWKIEGLDSREDAEKIVATARRGGRDKVGCIILGRGSDEDKVIEWLKTAASVPGFIGYAVGRTTWWDAVKAWREKKISEDEAAEQIAGRFKKWAEVFEASSVD